MGARLANLRLEPNCYAGAGTDKYCAKGINLFRNVQIRHHPIPRNQLICNGFDRFRAF